MAPTYMIIPKEDNSNPPDGRALGWIFEHCLHYPTTYDIPLRHMYTINCQRAARFRPRQRNPRHSGSNRSTGSAESSESAQSSNYQGSSDDSPRSSLELDDTDDFMAALQDQVASLPSQPATMPAFLYFRFLQRCFVRDNDDVDFLQALTAIDYLRDLHFLWKKKLDEALAALNITKKDLMESNHPELATKFPSSIDWLWDMFTKAHNLEAMYGQLYVNLRRFTLINEILLEPKHQHYHVALLNTLYPPVLDAAILPGSVTPRLLTNNRDVFFKWINLVSRNCSRHTDWEEIRIAAWRTLESTFRPGAPVGEKTEWVLTYDTLHKYLATAEELYDSCSSIVLSRARLPDDMDTSRPADESQTDNEPQAPAESQSPAEYQSSDEAQTSAESQRSKTRKADSGISFGSSHQPNFDKPLPEFPVMQDKPRKISTGLERLAGELKRIGFSKPKGLKKMKSTSALSFRPGSQLSYTDSNFEVDDDMRRRLIEQARSRKNSNASSTGSNEQSGPQPARM